MPLPAPPVSTARPAGLVVAALVALCVAGCSGPGVPGGVHDPYEAENRARFESNIALDRAVSRLAGGDSGADTDTAAESGARGGVVLRAVRNFGTNLSVPSFVMNDILQVRPHRAVENTLRFIINSTIGVGGLFDPAGAMGLHGRRSDFGETLHVWGFDEGAYLVLPVLGPSTERDAAGLVVDTVLDPWLLVLGGWEYAGSVVARWAARFGDRIEYGDLIDANVMQSADPYVQARLLFLQGRRYHLGIESEDDFIDPYADFFD